VAVKRHILTLVILGVLAVGVPLARAQTDWPPVIFLFTSDVDSVTVADLESGMLTTTLRWHVAHTDTADRILLDVYQGNEWIALSDAAVSLPSVGEQEVLVEYPRNFGSPTYRLIVIDALGRTQDQRVLVIPYVPETGDMVPSIFSFSALDQSVSATDLAAGTARVRVSWVIKNRAPLTHIMFRQVLNDDTMVNVELPRSALFIPSQGAGVVAPVAPPSGTLDGSIRLRLVVIDVISADVIDSKDVTVAVMGTALPSEADPAAQPEVTEPPEPKFGALTVLDSCTLFPPGVPERGWVDSNGIQSPNGLLIAYVTNGIGDAKLVIANASGTAQIVVDAPDKDKPLWSRPRWSPDGQRIVFSNITISSPGGGTFYVVSSDGTDLRKLATYTGYYDDFSWSADGQAIFFTSSNAQASGAATAQSYQIYSVSSDGLGTPQPVAQGCGVLE
jgi:hypothetical protein